MIGLASEVEMQGNEGCIDIGHSFRFTIEGCADQYLVVSEKRNYRSFCRQSCSIEEQFRAETFLSFKEIVQ